MLGAEPCSLSVHLHSEDREDGADDRVTVFLYNHASGCNKIISGHMGLLTTD